MWKTDKLFGLILALVGGLWLATLSQIPQSLAYPQTPALVVPGGTLVVASPAIPENLYWYSELTNSKRDILSAIFDGPIDTQNGDYRATILEYVPTVQNNLVKINAIEVSSGATVVDAAGNVITLANGSTVINSAGETVVFNGTPLLMNQTVVTFTLVSNLSWSDGAPLTDSDFVFGHDVACHPDTPTAQFNCFVTESFVDFPEPDSGLVWTGLPGFFNTYYMDMLWMPLPEHILDAIPPSEIITSTYALQPVGWGPYLVEQFIPGQRVVLGRNPYYVSPGFPQIDKIVFENYSEFDLAYQALIAGEVHLIAPQLVDPTTLASLSEVAQLGVIDIESAPTLVGEYLHFGITPADVRYHFFEDVEVRRAIALCTNREGLNMGLYDGQSEILHSYVLTDTPLTDGANMTEWAYNPSEGQAKLTAAGWLLNSSDGWRYKEGQKFAINYKTTSNNPIRQSIAERFQGDMAACGIEVTVEYLPASEFFADGPTGPVFGRQFDVVQFALVPEPNDGSLGCQNFLTANIPDDNNQWQGFNVYGYSNPNFDSACEEGIGELWGTAAYLSAHQEALQIWTADLPAIPLLSRVNTVVLNPNLRGLQFLTIQNGLLWNVESWYFTSENSVEPSDAGQLISIDSFATLDTPAGAFTTTAFLQYTTWLPIPQMGLVNSGRTFMLSAVDNAGNPLTFNNELTATLTITYHQYSLDVLDSFAPSLGLYYWDGSQWVLEPTSTLDLENQTVTASVNQLGVWALLSNRDNQPVYLPLVLTP